MNLCKSRNTVSSGGISARTKSLREKFSSKRSYSELSFKNSSSSLTDTNNQHVTGSSFKSPIRSSKPFDSEPWKRSLSKGEFSGYSYLPEEAYCSALDINCPDGERRFPWQHDVAIQCNLDEPCRKVNLSQESPKKSKVSGEKKSTLSGLSSLRFWKSSTPLNTDQSGKKLFTRSRFPRSVLHRAASFDCKRYSRLIQQPSEDSSLAPSSANPEASTLASASILASSTTLVVPKTDLSSTSITATSITSQPLVRIVASFPQTSTQNTPIFGFQLPNNKLAFRSTERAKAESELSCSSAPGSRSSSPPLKAQQLIESTKGPQIFQDTWPKRENFPELSYSAPDSFEEGSSKEPSDNERNLENLSEKHDEFSLDTMHELFQAKVAKSPCKEPMGKQFLLTLTATGQGEKNLSTYINLPSPNVHTEGQESSPVFKKFTGFENGPEESEAEEPVQEEPPASALHRRLALVPPKLITDGYESSNEDVELQKGNNSLQSNNHLTEPTILKSRRRSSIVVIPPMHICPGDLLVYSKVLNNRSDFLDNFDGSTQCLAVSEDASRKGKNAWSLLKLFDRSNRTKSDSLCGLEEVLSTLTPSVFVDEQLSKYKGITWSEFEAMFEERRGSSIVSGQRVPQLESDSRRSSGQSSDGTIKSSFSSERPKRPTLLRTHTFDFAQSSSNREKNLAVTNAHSTRSNSCIAPVTSSIKLLSGEFKEESIDELKDLHGQDGEKTDLTYSLMSEISPPPSLSGQCSSRSSLTVSRSEFKRREALWDLFQSECVFLYCHLMVLKNVFMEPLKKIQVEGFAMFAEPEVLFGNLDELCFVTYAFCKEFLILILQQMNQGDLNPSEVLVKLFQKSSKATALTQAYHRYTLNYINALNYLETLRRQVEFNEFEKWCSRDPRCKKLQLQDLLVSPVQHIMRVPLLLKDIETRTEDLSERELIVQIIAAEEASLRELDDKMKWLKNFERLLEIQRNIVWPPVFDLDPKVFIPEHLKGPLSKQPCERLIVSPRRQIIIEGPLNILDSGKPVEMWVILFDDMLVITRRKKGLHKKQSSLTEKWANTCSRGNQTSISSHEGLFKYVVYKQPLSPDRFEIHDITSQEGTAHNLPHAFVLVCLNRFQQIITIHTLQAQSESAKINWLFRLKDTADKWKRTLQNTVFRSH